MSKITWKPGTFEYPIPAVMVSCGNMEKSNIITVAWTGIINTNPAMVYISVRPERYSNRIIRKYKEFVINLTTEELASILKCSKSFVRKLKSNGTFPYYKIGSSIRFNKNEIL